MRNRIWPLLALSMMTLAPAYADTPARAPAAPAPKHVDIAVVEARADDVATVDGVLKALYDSISGPKGQPRQWARGRTLFAPWAHLTAAVKHKDKDGKVATFVRSFEWQGFADAADPIMVDKGFVEHELRHETHAFGNVASVLTSYEGRSTAENKVIARGVNHVQLYFDGKRWWITALTWDEERPDNPIPKSLLP